MTIIVHATKSDIPVVIIDQNRMTDSNALQQLYDEIVDELEGGRETANVLLDFELVETVTSPGLSMLIRAKNKFDEEGARLHLCSLSPNVAAVIETTAFDQLFPVHDSVESAQLALQSPPIRSRPRSG